MVRAVKSGSLTPRRGRWHEKKLLLGVLLVGSVVVVALNWQAWFDWASNLDKAVAIYNEKHEGPPVDTRVLFQEQDAFNIPGDPALTQPAATSTEPAATAEPTVESTDEPTAAATSKPEPTAVAPPDEHLLPGVDPLALNRIIRDNTPARAAEFDSFIHLFALAQGPPPDLLEQHLRKIGGDAIISYRQLLRQPTYYRGRVVRIAAVVQRVFPWPLPKNSAGLTQAYEVWLSTNDRANTVVLYVTKLPEGFPISEKRPDGTYKNLDEPVEAVGIFFKLRLYSADQGPTAAPMLLGHTLEWTEQRTYAQPHEYNTLHFSLALGTALLAALGLTAYVFIRSGQKARADAEVHWKGVSSESLQTLAVQPVTKTHDNLQELAQQIPDDKPIWQTLTEAEQQAEAERAAATAAPAQPSSSPTRPANNGQS